MAVVVDADDLFFENIFQLLQIDNEAGDGVDFANDGNLKGVIVAVTIAVGTLAENAMIFSFG